MNKYAKLAQRHWQTNAPQRYQAIEDPQTFFQALGAIAQSQIEALAMHLAGPDQPGEAYLEKVGRLNMARLQAEEAVLSELVWTIPEDPELEEPPVGWVSQTLQEIFEADPDNEPPTD